MGRLHTSLTRHGRSPPSSYFSHLTPTFPADPLFWSGPPYTGEASGESTLSTSIDAASPGSQAKLQESLTLVETPVGSLGPRGEATFP